MFEPKPIHAEAVDRALSKVERYRLLNEPREAESICRDILAAVPGHQEATVGLLLALTDQFGKQPGVRPEHANELIEHIEDAYAREYYAGVIAERWAKARLAAGDPGHAAFDWFEEAMSHFAKAQTLAKPGNDDAILRWNSCARIIQNNPQIRQRPDDEPLEHGFLDHVP